MPKRTKDAFVVASYVTLALFVVTELVSSAPHHFFFLGDFRAFYCGGWALVHGQNPYAAAPLMTCESAPQPFGLFSAISGLAVPAPFPAYALAFFSIFTVLPYAVAAIVWLALSLLCAVAAAKILARLTSFGMLPILLVFVTTYALIVFPLGQLTSVVLLSLVASALAMRNGKMGVASLLLCLAALSPHVALPAFLALFVWAKESRWMLAAAGAALIAIDVGMGGFTQALSYFTAVLPAHANAEVGGALQYSLTSLAFAAGASSTLALRLGEISYGVMIVAGVWAGGLLSRRYNDRAFIVLVPPAFAAIGGPFLHMQEITLALPAALLLYSRVEKKLRYAIGGSLVLIAMPWLWVMDQAWYIAVVAAAAGGIALGILRMNAMGSLRVSLGAVAISACIMFVGGRYGSQVQPKSTSVFRSSAALAQESWGRYVVKSSGVTWVAGKMPTWIGLLLLAGGCAGAFRTREDEKRLVAIEHAPIGT